MKIACFCFSKSAIFIQNEYKKGADDYLNKPFDPLELVARAQAILRRTQRGNLPLASFRYLVSRGDPMGCPYAFNGEKVFGAGRSAVV